MWFSCILGGVLQAQKACYVAVAHDSRGIPSQMAQDLRSRDRFRRACSAVGSVAALLHPTHHITAHPRNLDALNLPALDAHCAKWDKGTSTTNQELYR